ncbi:signal peptidase I [Pseudooceanicola sediminis]|uniref:Signal peptidase I n=1 Tax=Pseudooceanicola sediminis TaxID=2211117 RepID=A0A399J413_9RHOB|nr:signal peptidase I [Pseudooceanicola sediminis]KAA2315669.1 signal peptidase I [Puniceibacterium sp. HSS470]RII40133.1 signal peptidase I [Pseudooceanicola sediminis]|tara:strand:- start:61029 stop:61868 length:840 start_codon:yes stop_codon:yes gene_type:complete
MADKPKESGNFIWETVKTIFWALLIAGLFRTLFFQPFWIPSGSMKDTLLIGDFLFVNKMAYGYSYASCPSIKVAGLDLDAKDICGFLDGDGNSRLMGSAPERGDVVVFRHPVTGEDYIKRLIGLPGDEIQVRDSLLYINGEPVKQEDGGTFVETYEPQGPQGRAPLCSNAPVGMGGECKKTRIIETLPNGVTHDILDIRYQSQADDTGVYRVPEGHYFFMGDNRDNSTDSRFAQSARGVGFVPAENLIGRADRIIFSSAGRSLLFFWDWRKDRFFRKVD